MDPSCPGPTSYPTLDSYVTSVLCSPGPALNKSLTPYNEREVIPWYGAQWWTEYHLFNFSASGHGVQGINAWPTQQRWYPCSCYSRINGVSPELIPIPHFQLLLPGDLCFLAIILDLHKMLPFLCSCELQLWCPDLMISEALAIRLLFPSF